MGSNDRIDILIATRFDPKGAAAATKAAEALKKAWTGMGSGNAGAQATKAQADALRLQAEAAKAAAAQSNALGAAARASTAQANAAAAAARQQAQANEQTARSAAQAEKAIAQLAMQQARLAAAKGDASGGVQILQGALSKLTPNTLQAANVQTQLQQALNATNRSAQEANGGVAVLPRTFAGLSGPAEAAVSSLKAASAAALTTGAVIEGIQQAYDFSKAGASLQAGQQSFENLAKSAGTSSQALIASMQAASDGTIATSDIIKSSNTALLLLGNDVASKLPQLLAIAKASATTLGTDVGKAFNDLITGIARGSTELIDNLGISISAVDAQNQYAASIGKSANELTKAEKSQAVLNAVMAAGNDIIARTGGSADGAASGFQQLEASLKNASDSLSIIAATKIDGTIGGLGSIAETVADGFERMAEAPKVAEDLAGSLLEASDSYEEYRAAVEGNNDASNGFNAQLQTTLAAMGPIGSAASGLVAIMGGLAPTVDTASAAQYEYAQSLLNSGMSMSQVQAQMTTLGPTFAALATAQQLSAARSSEASAALASLTPRMAEIASSGAYGQAAITNLALAFGRGTMDSTQLAAALAILEAQIANASVAAANDAAMQAYRTGEIMAGTSATNEAALATGYNTGELEKELAAKQTNEQQTTTLAAANAELARLGDAVAGGLMTAGQAALIMAQQYNIAYSAALALINAQAQLGQAKINAKALSDQRAGERSGGGSMTFDQTTKKYDAERRLAQKATQAQRELEEAQRAQTMATGTQAAKLQLLRTELAKLTPGTAAYVDKQTEMLRLQQQSARSGGGKGKGGGGGGAKVTPQEKAAEKLTSIREKTDLKLQDIAQSAGEKLIDIDRKLQDKLIAIDEKAAEQRKAAYKSLMQDIQMSTLATDFQFSANDLDQFGKDLTDEQKNQFKIREEAERNYQRRMQDARQQAVRDAQNGDAQLAKDTLTAKEKEAQDLMALEQAYMQKRAEVDKKQLPALEKEYMDAVEARREQTNAEIALANAASTERSQAVQEEKNQAVADAQTASQAVIDEANKSANETIAAAQRSAGGVKNATDGMVADTVGAWQTIASAIEKGTEAQKRFNDAVSAAPTPSGGGGTPTPTETPTKLAGGGSVETNGPALFIAGDNPGGRERVTVEPLSGKGTSYIGAGMKPSRFAGGTGDVSRFAGGTPQGKETKWQKAIRKRDEGINAMSLGGSSFDLSGIDPAALDAALQKMTEIGKIIDAAARRNKVEPGAAKKFAETTAIIAQAVKATVDLRTGLMSVGETPIDATAVTGLLTELTVIADEFETAIGKRKLNVGLLSAYSEGIAAAMDVLLQMVEIRQKLGDVPSAAPSADLIHQLAAESREITRIVQSELIKLFQEERDALEHGGEALESAVGILESVIDLRSSVKDIGPPIILLRLQGLAQEANDIVLLLAGDINPATIKVREELSMFAEEVQSVVDTFSAVIDLRSGVKDAQFPISASMLQSLIDDTYEVSQAVANLVPDGFEAVAGLEEYADVADKATSVLSNMIDLRGQLTQLAAPINVKDVQQLSNELRRVVEWFQVTTIPYGQEMIQAVSDYGDVADKAVSGLQGMIDLREALGKLQPPINVKDVQQLSNELRRVVEWFQVTTIPYSQEMADAAERYGSLSQAAIESIQGIIELREDLTDLAPPVDVKTIQRLSNELREVVSTWWPTVIQYTEAQADEASRYASVAGDAASALGDAASLGSDISGASAIPMGTVQMLADDIRQVATIFKDRINVYSEEQADAVGRYASVTGDAVGTLSDAASLGEDLKAATAIPMNTVMWLADQTRGVATIFKDRVNPYTEEEADLVGRYASVAGDAIGTLNDAASLGEALNAAVPISDAVVMRVADETMRATGMFRSRILPTTEEEADLVGLYADAVSSSVDAISSVAGLSGDLLADYSSPTDAQLNLLVTDAQRIVAATADAAAVFDSAGLEATQKYAEALSTMVDGLLGTGQLIEGLKYGNDYTVDVNVLRSFESNAREIIQMGSRLGEVAASSLGNFNALSTSASAMNGLYDSLTNVASVPWGDLPMVAGAVPAMGGGGSSTVVHIAQLIVNQQPGQNGVALGQQIMGTLNQSVASRRATNY